jgi:hypothetical protein
MIKNKRTEGRIKAHYGIKDYYRYFRTEYPDVKITYKQFTSVIQKFNEEITNMIIEDNFEYVLPHLGSSLSVKKTKQVPRIVDGKLFNSTPVDWVATNKLWAEDEEAREKKLLVRYNNSHTSRYVFRINFKKYITPFVNKRYYKFHTCRKFARMLGNRINNEDKDRYDSYLLYKNNKI